MSGRYFTRRLGRPSPLSATRLAWGIKAMSHHEPQDVPSTMGHRRWAIAEGYIPGWSHGSDRALVSHEAVCLLNTSELDAHVEIRVFFSYREPVGPYHVTVPARRTSHVSFNDLNDPEPIPVATDYASVIESDVPIVVQHTRLDSREAENALMSTIAFHEDGNP